MTELTNALMQLASYGKIEVTVRDVFIRGNSDYASVYVGMTKVMDKAPLRSAIEEFLNRVSIRWE